MTDLHTAFEYRLNNLHTKIGAYATEYVVTAAEQSDIAVVTTDFGAMNDYAEP